MVALEGFWTFFAQKIIEQFYRLPTALQFSGVPIVYLEWR